MSSIKGKSNFEEELNECDEGAVLEEPSEQVMPFIFIHHYLLVV